jgi:hypothetical protein
LLSPSRSEVGDADGPGPHRIIYGSTEDSGSVAGQYRHIAVCNERVGWALYGYRDILFSVLIKVAERDRIGRARQGEGTLRAETAGAIPQFGPYLLV